jgi:outer membrane protein
MKALKWIVLSAALFVCSAGFSQTTSKIAQINRQNVITAMPELAVAQKAAEDFQKEHIAVIEDMQVELNKFIEEVSKGFDALSDVAKAAKQTEINDRQARIQEYQQNASTSIQAKQSELMQPILEKLAKTIEEVAKEQSITWVLDVSTGSDVIYSSTNAPDITQDVIKKLGITPKAQ